MASEQTRRDIVPNRSGADNEGQQDLKQDQQALRELIDQFCDHPRIADERGFYRNVGHYIARSVMKPRWPGDSGY